MSTTALYASGDAFAIWTFFAIKLRSSPSNSIEPNDNVLSRTTRVGERRPIQLFFLAPRIISSNSRPVVASKRPSGFARRPLLTTLLSKNARSLTQRSVNSRDSSEGQIRVLVAQDLGHIGRGDLQASGEFGSRHALFFHQAINIVLNISNKRLFDIGFSKFRIGKVEELNHKFPLI